VADKFGAIDQGTVLRVQASTIREYPFLNVRDDATSPCRVTTLLGLSAKVHVPTIARWKMRVGALWVFLGSCFDSATTMLGYM
jgi:hypothetical protein